MFRALIIMFSALIKLISKQVRFIDHICFSLQFFCSSCNHAVESPQTRTHLAVFVKVRSFPDAQVKVSVS